MGAEGPIRKMAEAPRRPGDRATAGARPTPTIGQSQYGRALEGEAHAIAGAIKSGGLAGLQHGNDWNGHPQLEMELRDWRESVAELRGISGPVSLNPAVANVWWVDVSDASGAEVVFSLAEPPPLTDQQATEGRFRARSCGLMLYVRRGANGSYKLPRIYWPGGEMPEIGGPNGIDVYAFQWNGGLGANQTDRAWFGFQCGASMAIPPADEGSQT